jgi:hypothetical protein
VTPQVWEGFAPHCPPREDGAKTTPPPALWCGLEPCGCCGRALHKPQRLVRHDVGGLRASALES